MSDKSQTRTEETESPPQGSTPDTGNQNTAVSVDTQQATPSSTAPKGDLKLALHSVRQQNKELKRQIEELRARQDAIGSVPQRNNATETGPSGSFLDNPEEHLAHREKRILEQATKMAVGELEQKQAVQQHREASVAAESWLLSQKEIVADPDAADEVADIINADQELLAISRVSPQYAVKAAMDKWRTSKGLSNERTNEAHTSAARAGGTMPSTPSGSGSKVFSMREWTNHLNSLDSKDPKFLQKWNEAQQAYNEGRVKK